MVTDPKKIDEILNRGTIVEVLPSRDEFRQKLIRGEKLKFYIGFDATAPTLHLSHAKNFMLLEKFRQLGHEVIILFGDFTARIGDPSDRKAARQQLSAKEVEANVKKWKELVEPLMDFKNTSNPPKIMYNSHWLAKMDLEKLLGLASHFTVQQMLERDMFQKRLAEGKPIHLHEFLYPLMQGYDSVAMGVDVEMCGTDQIFNALAGRTLLKQLSGKDKFVVAVTLMENPKTGELMSKSRGTGVFLNATPADFFGQIMAQPDEMIPILFVNNTFLSLSEIKVLTAAANPRDAKLRLAYEITKIIHGEKIAQASQQEFVKVFSQKEKPTEMPVIAIKSGEWPVIDLLSEAKLISSKSVGRRLIEQGGVKIDDQVVKDWQSRVLIKAGTIIQAGKRKFVRVK